MTNITPSTQGSKVAGMITFSAGNLVRKQAEKNLDINFNTSWVQELYYANPVSNPIIPVVSFIGSIIRNLDDKTRGLLKDQLSARITPPEFKKALENIGPNTQGAVKEAEVKGKEIAKQILSEISEIGEENYKGITEYISGIINQLENKTRIILENRLEQESTARHYLPEPISRKISRLIDQHNLAELKLSFGEVSDPQRMQELVDNAFIRTVANGDKSLEILKFISFPGAVTGDIEPSKEARLKAISESAKLASENPDEYSKSQEFLFATQKSLIKTIKD
jgi:hypothetical protein